jgi:hypothetical protein
MHDTSKILHLHWKLIRILKSYPALLLSPHPTGVRVKRSELVHQRMSILQETPQFFKKYRSQLVNPNPLYLPTSPSAPSRSLCPSSTPPPPLTFSPSGCSSSPLPALHRRCRPAYSHRIQIRRAARLGVGATAPLLELREHQCGNLSLSACLDRFFAPSSRSEEGLAAPCQHKRCRRDQRGLAISSSVAGHGLHDVPTRGLALECGRAPGSLPRASHFSKHAHDRGVARSRARARERRGIDPASLRW